MVEGDAQIVIPEIVPRCSDGGVIPPFVQESTGLPPPMSSTRFQHKLHRDVLFLHRDVSILHGDVSIYHARLHR